MSEHQRCMAYCSEIHLGIALFLVFVDFASLRVLSLEVPAVKYFFVWSCSAMAANAGQLYSECSLLDDFPGPRFQNPSKVSFLFSGWRFISPEH